MSIEALHWAFKQETANSGQKLVLVFLANITNPETGQCNPSHKRIAAQCCMGVSTLKKHIAGLEARGLLTINHRFFDNVQSSNQYVLHIYRQDSSQNPATPQPEFGYPPGQNLATETVFLNQRRNINTVGQEEKSINNPSLFDIFWKAYPRKVGPANARKAFAKLKVDNDLLKKMLSSIEQQKPLWKDPQYIPHPSSWLNGERWEDEVNVPQAFNPFAGSI